MTGPRWFVPPRRPQAAAAAAQPPAMFCFPPPGVPPSSFQHWRASFEDVADIVGLRYPGRESRWGEDPYESAEELGHAAAEAIARDPAEHVALFGYCGGALVAFETAHALAELQRPASVLIVAFQVPPNLVRPPAIAPSRDADAAELLRRAGVAADRAEVILASPEAFTMVGRSLRAELTIVESYRFRYRPRLILDLVTLTAANPEAERAEWEDLVTGTVRVRELTAEPSPYDAPTWARFGTEVAEALSATTDAWSGVEHRRRRARPAAG